MCICTQIEIEIIFLDLYRYKHLNQLIRYIVLYLILHPQPHTMTIVTNKRLFMVMYIKYTSLLKKNPSISIFKINRTKWAKVGKLLHYGQYFTQMKKQLVHFDPCNISKLTSCNKLYFSILRYKLFFETYRNIFEYCKKKKTKKKPVQIWL